MVVIRLARGGKKKCPYYRVVAADKRMPRDGRFIELVGTFNPRVEKGSIALKIDRVEHWLNRGAQPSNTVKGLIKKFRALLPKEAGV
jgi:small subunit ribosomal protein S16